MQFRTKARAVDLLGKGQIADLPTAITELWKNGYDAYADKLSAELYTVGYEDVENPFFVLSDDGKGMSFTDIRDRWLVLGTDSKSRGTLPQKGEDTLMKDPRPIMGEKGIGRLSVSYLGSPMLMLSKKIGFPLQALYFDWRTLENYNLFLDDVIIPIQSINNLDDFDNVFFNLKKEFLSNFIDQEDKERAKEKKAIWADQEETFEEIINSTSKLSLPHFFVDEIVRGLIGDKDDIHGTKFIIFEPDEQFEILKKWSTQLNNADDQDIDTVNDIRTGLVGFLNEFKKGGDADENSPEEDTTFDTVSTSFIIKDKTGSRDFIGSSTFFNADDFEVCDHLIEGEFDEYGTFTGDIRVYKKLINDYQFRSNRPSDQITSYGKFRLKLGYVPGVGESSLEEKVFEYFNQKLRSYGGLYIYRDNLRVLPYGRPHSDFLQFEERRSRRAGSYFFSYRRMFGYIELSREYNYNLKDKAGREGFINNKAFREFKLDLEGLFLDLAKQYFGTEAKSDIKQKQLDDIKETKATEKEEKELENKERKDFKNLLNSFPKKIENIDKEFRILYSELSNKVAKSNVLYQDIQVILRKIDTLKSSLENIQPSKPKRFKMTAVEREKYEDAIVLYNNYYNDFESITDLRNLALKKIEEEQLFKEYQNKFNSYTSQLDNITELSKANLKEAFKHIDQEFEKTEVRFKNDLEELYNLNIPNPKTRENLEDSIEKLELGFSEIRLQYQRILDAKSDHLLKMNFDLDDDALIGLYKDRYDTALKELSDFKNLAQLGIAVEIINHELNSMYSQLSTSILEINKFIKDSKESQKHYKYLKNSFEHLDSKYQSLNPLYRGNRRTKKYIKGVEIIEYVNNFFEETIKEENINIEVTNKFINSEIYTFESILYPAIINVINNAIYWLRSVNNPKILLDYDDGLKAIIISNNGPEIRDSSLTEIFELFYTRRPKGRGIGLYLSKDGLNTVGLDMIATNDSKYNRLAGATFLIKPLNS